jgi:hypothetical protein
VFSIHDNYPISVVHMRLIGRFVFSCEKFAYLRCQTAYNLHIIADICV